jgi:hypothetical protein
MSRLQPGRLHVRLEGGLSAEGPGTPRRYTLTHSDASGELFLTIGREYDGNQISGWYTRLMRDEVLAEWREQEDGPSLHVYCHVSGGLVFGSASFRYNIFRRELPLVLEALRYGDRRLFEAHPELDEAPVRVHFHSSRRRYHRRERWGTPADYRLEGL